MPDTVVLGRAAALGLVAGMRSMTPPAAVSRHLANGDGDADGGVEGLLARPAAPWVLGVAAAGELVADKLPSTPNRTDAGPLGARIASGALCGAVVARRAGESAATGALVGAIAALAGTFAAYHVRRALTAGAGLPDLPVALAEDLAALTIAEAVLRE